MTPSTSELSTPPVCIYIQSNPALPAGQGTACFIMPPKQMYSFGNQKPLPDLPLGKHTAFLESHHPRPTATYSRMSFRGGPHDFQLLASLQCAHHQWHGRKATFVFYVDRILEAVAHPWLKRLNARPARHFPDPSIPDSRGKQRGSPAQRSNSSDHLIPGDRVARSGGAMTPQAPSGTCACTAAQQVAPV